MVNTNYNGMPLGEWYPGQRINPLFNAVFTRTFGREESKGFVCEFVNLLFDRVGMMPIEEILLIRAEHSMFEGDVSCKASRVDVHIVAPRQLIDLEAQRYPEDLEGKSAYYASQMLIEDTKVGSAYKDMRQAVVITLLDEHIMFPDIESPVSVCKMHWEDPSGNRIAPTEGARPRVAFVVVELEKVRRRYNRLDREVLSDRLTSWLYLLACGYRNEAEVDEMSLNVKSIEEFAQQYGRAINDPELKKAYDAYVWSEREIQSQRDWFKRVGLQEGLQEGRKEEAARVAALMREKGYSEEQIAELFDGVAC